MAGYEINNFTPTDETHIKYITLGSDIQKDAVPYSNYYNVDKNIESSMNKYIRYISSIDPSVNDHIFTRKLKVIKD